MSKEKSSYSDKPLLQRVVLFLAGFSNILIGYALYFMFKDDKAKDWQIEFVQRGATFGLAFIIIGLIVVLIGTILHYLALPV
ncbi:unknown [Clostridium sp. CAG:1193]|nr:unknown [Clostridium sp. CAG:1193]